MLVNFVLHMMCNSAKFDGIVAVYLGTGTGKVVYAWFYGFVESFRPHD